MSELSKTQQIIYSDPCMLQTWKLRPRERKVSLQILKAGYSRTSWPSSLLEPKPGLLPPHLANTIILQLLCVLPQPAGAACKKEKKIQPQSVAEILASLKCQWLHSAAVQVPAKLFSSPQLDRALG